MKGILTGFKEITGLKMGSSLFSSSFPGSSLVTPLSLKLQLHPPRSQTSSKNHTPIRFSPIFNHIQNSGQTTIYCGYFYFEPLQIVLAISFRSPKLTGSSTISRHVS